MRISSVPCSGRLALVLVLVLAAAAGGCDAYVNWHTGEVGKNLRRLLREQQAKQVDLPSVTRFEWDEFHPFGPYSSKPLVCNTLSLDTATCEAHVPAGLTSDSEMLLVFRKGGRIVHTEVHFRINGDFLPLPDKLPIRPDAARFDVVADGESSSGKTWLRLKQR